MSSTDLMATEDKANEVSLVPEATTEFTDESALEAIQSQETKIKKAAKKRTAVPKSAEMVKKDFTFDVSAGTIAGPASISFLLALIGMIATTSPNIEVTDLKPILAPIMLTGYGASVANIILVALGVTKRITSIVFRKNIQKKLAENEAEHRLWELKEKEYKKVEKKALSKAQPALDYVNSKMTTNEMIFSNDTLGEEGFSVAKRKLNNYEKALIEMKSSSKELESSPEANTPLAIIQKEQAHV